MLLTTIQTVKKIKNKLKLKILYLKETIITLNLLLLFLLLLISQLTKFEIFIFLHI